MVCLLQYFQAAKSWHKTRTNLCTHATSPTRRMLVRASLTREDVLVCICGDVERHIEDQGTATSESSLSHETNSAYNSRHHKLLTIVHDATITRGIYSVLLTTLDHHVTNMSSISTASNTRSSSSSDCHCLVCFALPPPAYPADLLRRYNR